MRAVHHAILIEQRVIDDPRFVGKTVKVLRLEDLHIPIQFALGRYEAATQEEIDDLISDLTAELDRRQAARTA